MFRLPRLRKDPIVDVDADAADAADTNDGHSSSAPTSIYTDSDASSSEEAYEPSRTTKPRSKSKSKPKPKPKPKPKSKPKPDATKRKRTAPAPSARTGARQAKRQRQRAGAAAVAVAVAVGAEAGQQAGGQELRTVPDALAPSLICVLIGLNPGIMTAAVGHMYAHPRNHFWRLMHAGGLTPDRVCPPEMDQQLPAVYSLGLTNLVERASVGQADLSRAEMAAGVAVCEEKLRRWRPESVCIVGKGIWEAIWQARRGRRLTKEQFVWGWQEERWGAGQGWEGARVYVVPSTSGLVAGISMEFKTECWRTLGDWVQMRRWERAELAPRVIGAGVGAGAGGGARAVGALEAGAGGGVDAEEREVEDRRAEECKENEASRVQSEGYDESIFDESILDEENTVEDAMRVEEEGIKEEDES